MIYEVQGNDQQGWIVEAVGPEGERYASRPFKDAATAANCAHFAEEITRSFTDFTALIESNSIASIMKGDDSEGVAVG